jgi:hypothetical protein
LLVPQGIAGSVQLLWDRLRQKTSPQEGAA